MMRSLFALLFVLPILLPIVRNGPEPLPCAAQYYPPCDGPIFPPVQPFANHG